MIPNVGCIALCYQPPIFAQPVSGSSPTSRFVIIRIKAVGENKVRLLLICSDDPQSGSHILAAAMYSHFSAAMPPFFAQQPVPACSHHLQSHFCTTSQWELFHLPFVIGARFSSPLTHTSMVPPAPISSHRSLPLCNEQSLSNFLWQC